MIHYYRMSVFVRSWFISDTDIRVLDILFWCYWYWYWLLVLALLRMWCNTAAATATATAALTAADEDDEDDCDSMAMTRMWYQHTSTASFLLLWQSDIHLCRLHYTCSRNVQYLILSLDRGSKFHCCMQPFICMVFFLSLFQFPGCWYIYIYMYIYIYIYIYIYNDVAQETGTLCFYQCRVPRSLIISTIHTTPNSGSPRHPFW